MHKVPIILHDNHQQRSHTLYYLSTSVTRLQLLCQQMDTGTTCTQLRTLFWLLTLLMPYCYSYMINDRHLHNNSVWWITWLSKLSNMTQIIIKHIFQICKTCCSSCNYKMAPTITSCRMESIPLRVKLFSFWRKSIFTEQEG